MANEENEAGAVEALYGALLAAWNRRSAADFAGLFVADGLAIGFDGSSMDGRAAIEASIGPIFRDHPTPAYVAKVRDVRVVAPGVAVLWAGAGLVPPGSATVMPGVNAQQVMVAVQRGDGWAIASYQNTPAAFHGRPELDEALTAELQAELDGHPAAV